jgi:DNA-binding transcriptional LysR family regulator
LAEIVAPAAARLRDSHPRLRLTITEQEAPGCFTALARGDADLALSMASRLAPPADDFRFTQHPLRADTLDAVLPAGHPLAGRERIALADLAAEPFVGPPDGTSCHDVTVNGCAAAGFTPGFEHWSLDFYTTMALVAAGLGVALVPRLAQAAVPPGAVIRPLETPAPARHVFAATRAGAERRPTVAAVLEALRA